MAALVSWIIAAAMYVAGLVLGYPIPREALIAVLLIGTVGLSLTAHKIAAAIIRYVANLLAREEEDIFLSLEEEDFPPSRDELFLVWILVRHIVAKTTPDVKRVALFADTGELNPDYMIGDVPSTDLYAMTPESVEGWGRVKAIYYSEGGIAVVLETEAIRELAKAIEKGGGEKIVIESEDQLALLYDIAKKVYKARYPDADDLLAAYVAYKAIRALADEGIIEASEPLLSLLPYENEDIRKKVIAQVQEEELASR